MASRERAIVNNLNERSRFYGRPASEMLTIDDVRAVMAFYNYSSCLSGTKPATSVDHVKPLALGGTNTRDNLQLLTIEENKSKGNEEIDYRKGAICPDDFTPEQTEPETTKSYRKHDWDEIEFEFVSAEHDLTLRELAKKHGVSLSHIGLISSRENWQKKRDNFRNKLGTTVLAQAAEEQIDLRLEISRTTLDFLKIWRRQANRIGNQDLIKILELGARASGLELDKRSITLKDWRDVADDQAPDLDTFATETAARYYSGGDSGEDIGAGAGWSD